MPDLPDYRRAARTVSCSRCGAAPGEPCRTSSGRADREHAVRHNLVATAFRIGVESGLSDALVILGAAATLVEACEQTARQHEFVRRGNLKREAVR